MTPEEALKDLAEVVAYTSALTIEGRKISEQALATLRGVVEDRDKYRRWYEERKDVAEMLREEFNNQVDEIKNIEAKLQKYAGLIEAVENTPVEIIKGGVGLHTIGLCRPILKAALATKEE